MLEPRSGTRLTPATRARLSWWLPPLLALLALVFHWAFDVPKAEMLARPTAEEQKAQKAKKRAELRKMNRERTRQSKRWTGRSPDEVASLRREWMTTPIEDEPRDSAFRKHHEAVLRGAVSRARARVLDGAATQAIQIRPTCHTIRCTLELCGPRELIDDIAEALPETKVVPKLAPDGPLFLELREIEAKNEPSRAREGFDCRRWLLSFDRDNTELRDLRL